MIKLCCEYLSVWSICMDHMVLSVWSICDFVNEPTAYVFHVNLKTHLGKLDENFELGMTWLKRNSMKLNTDKCHLIVSETRYENV